VGIGLTKAAGDLLSLLAPMLRDINGALFAGDHSIAISLSFIDFCGHY